MNRSIVFLSFSFMSCMLLPAAERSAVIAAQESLFPFKLGVDTFDDETVKYYNQIVSDPLAAAKTYSDSEVVIDMLSKGFKLMNKNDLNVQLQDPQVARLATEMYNAIQKNERVKNAFEQAYSSVVKPDPLEQRLQAWKKFLWIGVEESAKQRLSRLSTPRSQEMFLAFMERIEDVAMTEDQQQQQQLYDAHNIAVWALAQNHRCVDPETYSPNFNIKD